MKVAYKTDIGLLRQENEDRLFADRELGLFIVADGMGGHESGEIASEMAVNITSSYIKGSNNRQNNSTKVIREAIRVANTQIYERSQRSPNRKKMGSTIVLAFLNQQKVYFAHVGDSRVYLIRNGRLKRLTKDHSIVAELVKLGELSQSDTRNHRLRHIIIRALGLQISIEADVKALKRKPGDLILLCTDGLTDMLEDHEILGIVLRNSELTKTCTELIQSAKNKGGKDNITVLLIELP